MPHIGVRYLLKVKPLRSCLLGMNMNGRGTLQIHLGDFSKIFKHEPLECSFSSFCTQLNSGTSQIRPQVQLLCHQVFALS
jgi:hypothetical protein